MTSKFLQNIFRIRPQRSFSAWQIELTTRCPLRCRMCIREGLPGWKSHDMPMAEFRKLVPCFEVVQNVVLEGWGEPLLHPHLLEAVRLVKQQGARAGFVTSGKGLSQDYSKELIDAGVDFLGFSLAGATAATHNAIRVNSDFQELLKSIRQLVKIKLGQKAGTPRLHIVYLMLRDNLHEVPLLLDIARQVGLDEEVLINLVHITNAWQESQRVFRCEEQATEWLLVNLQQQARKLNIRRYQAASTSRPEGGVRRQSAAQSVRGGKWCVSPCVYLGPPTASSFPRIFCGSRHLVEKAAFGNLFAEPLAARWERPRYTAFRECFMARSRVFKKNHPSVGSSLLWDASRVRKTPPEALPDPPEPCRTCHKMLGV
jgi:MoaA/NifB/PqqE/SkfB family radical SAM enzyme